MMKPMTKKILLGAPAVALSAALACTMVACGGGGGEQGESGGDAAASKSAYESQRLKSKASPSNRSPMARTIAANSTDKMASGCAYASQTRATSR